MSDPFSSDGASIGELKSSNESLEKTSKMKVHNVLGSPKTKAHQISNQKSIKTMQN